MRLFIDHEYVSILTIQHSLLTPINICVYDVRINEFPNFLHPKYKDKAHAVISHYHVKYSLLIIFNFNDSIELHNT